MKKFSFKKVGVAALCACVALTPCLAAACSGGSDDPGKYKGVTDTTIYVGNTAAVTGVQASIGAPFNYGIKAALYEYNQKGGFSGTYDGKEVSGLKVALKTYDDLGDATNSVTYMNRLIEEDEVFAIVGNYGSYAVNANLDIIKEAHVPMVYAAAGNEEMAKDKATGDDRYIFPVQPINSTEGSVLIKRAFASTENGGLGGTKVGVISNNGDASIALENGIKKGANSLTAAQKGNINYQKVSDTDTGYGSAATALKSDGCDVVILAIATDYVKAISALMDAGFTSQNVKILTTYNNAATNYFDITETVGETTTTHFDAKYTNIIDAIHTQGWIDITDNAITGYWYKTEGGLWDSYKALAAALGAPTLYDLGVPGFCEEYWSVAEALYAYGAANASDVPTGFTAYTLSYNSFALAGYIAGDLFCKGLEMLGDKPLTRSNYVDAMESGVIDLALADTISYQNGQRLGVTAFSLNQLSAPYGVYGTTGSTVISSLKEFN